MTHEPDQPGGRLPKFAVNVQPTGQISVGDLTALLQRFRGGDAAPLVFGDGNRPEAVIIPFSAFLRLMKRDQAEFARGEVAFRDEVSRRVAEADAHDSADGVGREVTVERLARELGVVGQRWADEMHSAQRGDADRDG